MPNMIERRICHSLVVVKNKLFVIGGYYSNGRCEVFESICNKFVSLESPYSILLNKSLSIGNKMFIFYDNESVIVSYDVDKDEWSEEPCEFPKKHIYYRSCVKLPKLPIC